MTNHVKKGTIEIIYCPTDKMTGDFMTKPLQGSMFASYYVYAVSIVVDSRGMTSPGNLTHLGHITRGIRIPDPHVKTHPVS